MHWYIVEMDTRNKCLKCPLNEFSEKRSLSYNNEITFNCSIKCLSFTLIIQFFCYAHDFALNY